jgi:hypothetical protein
MDDECKFSSCLAAASQELNIGSPESQVHSLPRMGQTLCCGKSILLLERSLLQPRCESNADDFSLVEP